MNDAALLSRGARGGRAFADDVVEELWFGDVDDVQDEAHAAASLAARLADVQGLKELAECSAAEYLGVQAATLDEHWESFRKEALKRWRCLVEGADR